MDSPPVKPFNGKTETNTEQKRQKYLDLVAVHDSSPFSIHKKRVIIEIPSSQIKYSNGNDSFDPYAMNRMGWHCTLEKTVKYHDTVHSRQ